MWAQRWPGCLVLVAFGCEAPFVPVEPGAAGSAEAGQVPSAGQSGTDAGGDLSGGGRAGDGGKPSSGAGQSPLGGSGGSDSPPLTACENLPEPGRFEEITPPQVKAGLGETTLNGDVQGGPFTFELDPIHHGTYYLGTEHQGLWKTTNCGREWALVATGKNGAAINRGINWTLGIDHQDPSTLYTSSAYSVGGLFRSTDGGVSWAEVWSAATQPELSQAFEYNFVHQVLVDPRDAQHLLVTMHEACKHATTCILESKDAGKTWALLAGDASWEPDTSLTLRYLEAPGSWLVGSQGNGVWRTTDAGKTWSQLQAMIANPQVGIELLRAADGVFYLGASDGIWRSVDGALDSWELVPDSGPFVAGLTTDGKSLYASTCYADDYCEQPRYLTSTDGKAWQPMAGVPPLSQGGLLRYDAGHQLLVSSNGRAGVWRVAPP